MLETIQPHLPYMLAASAATLPIAWGVIRCINNDKTPEKTSNSEDTSPPLTQAEIEALQEDVKRYTLIADQSKSLLWTRDNKLNIQWCNLPYKLAIEGEGDEDKIPELYNKSTELAKEALKNKNLQTTHKHIIIGGDRKYYEIRERYIPELDIIKGSAIDVTELEIANKEISLHKQAQSDWLESSTSAMAIYGTDKRLKSYNQPYLNMWGADETWLDTQPDFGEILEWMREQRLLPEQANFKAFKSNMMRIFTDMIEPREEVYHLPDGRTIRKICIPHALGGVLTSYEDVTDRLALERSYNTLIAVQRETLDNLHEGIIVIGEDGLIRLTNPEFHKLWNLDPKDINERTHYTKFLNKIRPLLPKSNWENDKQDFITKLQSRKIYDSKLDRADDSTIDRTMVPLPDGGTLLTYTDITDSTVVERSLREKNDALQAADRLKSEFLANMSYELRSPLTSISGFAEMLSQDYFGKLTEKQQEYVEGISTSSNQLMHLISDILDLASIEAGYLTLQISEFDVHKMLQSVLSLLKERIKESQIHATIICLDDISTMKGDETRIRQTLLHLLSNAVKYSNDNSEVKIGAERASNGIKLWVEDKGAGIDYNEHAHIFDKFYRGQAGTRKSGTGLGLSMVKNFIDLHGGEVVIESEINKGTKVSCIIPFNPPLTNEETQSLNAAT